MKITKVTYQKTYSIGPYLTERIGFEAEPEGIPGDTPKDMLTWLEELADEWHKNSHPHLHQEKGFGDRPESQQTQVTFASSPMPIIDKKWDQFEVGIDNARTLEELEAIVRHYGTFPGKFLPIINAKRQSFKSPTKPIN